MRVRYTYKDIARRYIRLYGGSLSIDEAYGDMIEKVYLMDKHGAEIAVVNMSDFYEPEYDPTIYDDLDEIPY